MSSATVDGHDPVDAFERATRMLVGLASRSLAQLAGGPVSIAQFRLLAVLSETGPLASSRAAAALRLNASSVTRLADRLQTQGLLTRTREPENRSVVTLSLTEQGSSLVDRVLRWRRNALARLLGQLDSEEVLAASRTLDRLADLAASDEELADMMPFPHG